MHPKWLVRKVLLLIREAIYSIVAARGSRWESSWNCPTQLWGILSLMTHLSKTNIVVIWSCSS
jgi:hypothetical protein